MRKIKDCYKNNNIDNRDLKNKGSFYIHKSVKYITLAISKQRELRFFVDDGEKLEISGNTGQLYERIRPLEDVKSQS